VAERTPRKALHWIGSSLDDLRAFPGVVRQTVGFALFQAQLGGKHVDAKPLKGFGGAGVLEVIDDNDGSTYRAVYTIRFRSAVYVLHAFQKKSKRGIATPQKELEKVERRLKVAAQHHKVNYEQEDEP
jgi:phage-related protein